MLVNPSPFLRSVAGIIVTSIATVGGLRDWPELLHVLVAALRDVNLIAVEVAMHIVFSCAGFAERAAEGVRGLPAGA